MGEGYACCDSKLCGMREYLDCVRRIKDVVLIQQVIGHGGLGTNSRQLLDQKVAKQQIDDTDLIGVLQRL